MLSQNARPQCFKEVAGQKLAKELLISIVRKPNESPRSLLLTGEFGTGKTTTARIFAKALNCPNKKDYEPCNRPDCPICSQDINNSSFYQEYDSTIIGNVETIRELRDTFYYNIKGQYKVIVLDECHSASKPAQTSLLKVIEEAPQGIFFLFPTTHAHQLLPTIVSRCLEIPYYLVPSDAIIPNLFQVAQKHGFVLDKNNEEDVRLLTTIAHKSGGHMRNAHMLLDSLQLLGKETFLETVSSIRPAICKYFLSLVKKDSAMLFDSVSDMLTHPLADIVSEFDEVTLNIMKCLVNKTTDTPEGKLANIYGINFIKVSKVMRESWFINSTTNDLAFQTALLSIYQMLNK